MNIELRKPALGVKIGADVTRRFRDVFVDDEPRGYFAMHHHGCHGPSYELRAVHGGNIDLSPNERYTKTPSVHPTKKNRWSDEPQRPRDELLLELVEQQLSAGNLPTWTEVEERRSEYSKRRDAARKREESELTAKLTERAQAVMDEQGMRRQGPEQEKAEYDALRDRIVAALRWAKELS